MDRVSPWVPWTVAAVAAFVASLSLIGADALWLVPLGREVAHGHLPGSIPWATAPTSGWHDVPAVGQLVFWAAWHALGGYRGLGVAQVVATAVAFWALARGLAAEAQAGAVVAVSAIVLVGSLSAVVVVGVSLYSLACFPLLLLLLESESRTPSPRIWLAVPLLAVWGNLHGGVLSGWALLACYLLLDRARRQLGLALGVLAAGVLALFANPTLWNTVAYYRGVLGNEAARRGVALWTPLRLGGVDLFLIVAAAVLFGLIAWRRNIRPWEAVAIAGLTLATIEVARIGPFLLLAAAYPAARGLAFGVPGRALRIVAVVFSVSAVLLLARSPNDPGSEALAKLAASSGKPVLAEAVLGQQVALAGGRTWVGNPIDAFRRADQSVYLDWLDGKPGGAAAIDHAGYVLVASDSSAAARAARDPQLALVARNGNALLYRRK
jgi:hypothetical protein